MSNFKYTLEFLKNIRKLRKVQHQIYVSLNRCPAERLALRRMNRYDHLFLDAMADLRKLWAGRLNQSVDTYTAFCFSCLTNSINPFDEDVRWVFNDNERLSVKAAESFNDWRSELDRDALPFGEFDPEDHCLVAVGKYYEYEEDTWWCDHCDERHGASEDSTEVVTRLNGTRPVAYATVCSNANYFYCDYSGEYYDGDIFNSAESDRHDTVCDEVMRASDWYWDEENDRWTEDDPSEGTIPDYHDGNRSAIRRAVDQMARHPLTNRKYRRYGIEMEVDFDSRDDAIEWYNDQIPTDACIERDGSLNRGTGVEIISTPIPLTEWRSDNWYTNLLATARDAGATAWRHRATYGCHVNVDLRGVTDQQVALFVALVNNMESLYAIVSGRRKVYNGGYTKVERFDPNAPLLGVDNYIRLGSKYQPVRVEHMSEPDLRYAEVRTFGANLRPGAVLEYIELVDATLCYAQYLSTLPYQLDLFDDIPLSAYPIAEAFNDSVNGFLRWLPSEYNALLRLLHHRDIVADMPTVVLNNKIDEVCRG